MTLRVQFWGTRGSIPSPGPHTVKYGGNTPCIEVRTGEGWLIVLDAGTGIRELGRSLLERAAGAPVRGDILLSHAHWDHIQGFPFFAPIFGRENHFTVLGAQALETSVDRVLRDQMSPVVFPVTFEELDATIDFEQVGADVRVANGYELRAMPVRHPGGALAFRLNETGTPHRALVYVTDNELGTAARYDVPPDWRERFVGWIRGAAVLIHDAMYTDAEYGHHRGWGHSTDTQAVELALEAAVDTLVLFHHKPERGDAEVDRRVDACRRLVDDRGGAVHVIAAAEGMSLTV